MAKGKLRSILDDNPTIGLFAALLVLACSLGAILFYVFSGNSGPQPIDVYFYDMETRELFAAKSTDIAPIESPSGGTGVRAYVYACNDCSDPNDRFIAYVEMFTPAYKEAVINPQPITPENQDNEMNITMIMEEGHLIARPGSDKWMLAASDRSFALISDIGKDCNGGVPINCLP